jgi:futalosine hydrolase
MSAKIAFVSATEKEIEPLLDYLRIHAEQHSFQTYQLHGLQIDILISGIGIMQTTYTLMDYLSHRHPDAWIQAGIGGAFDSSLAIGDVFQIKNEMLSGFGAEDPSGNIMDPFALGWNDPDDFPYSKGLLECPETSAIPLPFASGMTTLYANGHHENIERLRKQPHGQIENMEGASFFYISLIKKIRFMSIRSISNRVESRDVSKWEFKRAIENLNTTIIGMLENSKFNPDNLFVRHSR